MIEVSKYLRQTDQKLFVIKKCELHIHVSDYDIGKNLLINENEKFIYLKGLISTLVCDKNSFDIILDYSVKVFYDEYIEQNERIIIKYEEKDLILEVPIEYQEIRESVLYLQRLLAGKEVFKDVNHLFMKLYKVYQSLSNIDLVHLEVLLSQCLRDKNNQMIPSRTGSDPLHPNLFNIKKNVFSTSFLQGLAFENIGEAIKVGLTSDHELQPSILEKILTGSITEKKK